jgi:hypothetical protein
MIYYILDCMVFMMGILFSTSISRQLKVGFAIIFFFILILFGGLRYEVGADWESYLKITNSIDFENFLESGVEPLFSFLCLIVKECGLNYHSFVFIAFTLATSLKFHSIFKYSTNFFASLMIYFPIQLMSYDMNGIRQGLAMAVLLCSIKYLLDRSFIKFLIVCIIAIGFHASAVVFIPFYFVANTRFNRKLIHFILLASIVIGFMFQSIILNYILPQLGGVESILAEKALGYSESEAFGTGLSLGFSTLHRLIIFYLFYYFYDKIQLNDNFKNLLLNAYLFSLIIYFLFSAIEIIGARGSLYYRTMDIFMIASFLSIKKDFSYRLVVLILIFIYSLSGIYTNLKMPLNGLVPYDNLLFHF